MTTRELPRGEWHRLETTELGPALAYLPDDTKVMVVEHHGDLVGCWAVIPYLHVEGLWIHPAHRSLGRALLALAHATRTELEHRGARVVLTTCLDGDKVVRGLLERQDALELPGRSFVMRTEKIGCRQ
jgi:hypothetical protein